MGNAPSIVAGERAIVALKATFESEVSVGDGVATVTWISVGVLVNRHWSRVDVDPSVCVICE